MIAFGLDQFLPFQGDIKMSIDRNSRMPVCAASNRVTQCRRSRLFGFAALMLAALPLCPNAVHAQMTVTPGGTVQLNATTATNATTNTDGANASSLDQIQLWDNGTPIIATTDGVDSITGNGLTLQETGATTGAISMTNAGSSSISSSSGIGLQMIGNGGGVTYTDTGSNSITGNTAGMTASETGSGAISLTANGTVVGNTGDGIDVSAADGGVQATINNYVDGNLTGMNAIATGNGAVALTITGAVIGNTGDGIDVSAGDGGVQAMLNGYVNGNLAGMNAIATGNGAIALTVNGTVTGNTGDGIDMSAGDGGVQATINGDVNGTHTGLSASVTGAGSIAITNSGTISGGTAAIAIAAPSGGTVTIINNAGGNIGNNAGGGGLAILSTTATGADEITNAGSLTGEIALSDQSNSFTNSGAWGVQDGAADAADFGASGLNTLTNSGTINAASGSATTATFTGIETVNNAGTINVNGTAYFEGSGSFANAGLIDMGSATSVLALNVAVSGNTYTPGAAPFNFAGGTGSTLGLAGSLGAVGSSGANVMSDRLVINGTATGTTGILFSDTNAGGAGAYNPVGITLVAVNGASTNAFYLQGVSGAGETFEPSIGPMGAIKKGFWIYPLLQTLHATAVADGLTATGSSEYRLYGLPGVEALQLPLAVAGAQDIWYDTVLDWSDRQDELRKHWSGVYGPEDAYRGGQFNFWMKATGNWDNRSNTSSLDPYAPVPGSLPGFDTSFNQTTSSVQVGTDVGFNGFLGEDGVLVFGTSLGFVDSALDFKTTNNTFKYLGATVEATADYLNGGLFWDTAIKTDLLQLNVNQISLSSFGATAQSIEADTWGVQSSAGYHIGFDTNPAASYLEPLVTLAYTRSDFGNFSDIGTATRFNSSDTFRGALGARFGGELFDSGSRIVDASLTGNYWNEFTNNSGVTLLTTGPAVTLNDIRAKGFGQVTGQVNVADKGTGFGGFIDAGAKFNGQFTSIEASGGISYKW
jgi:hypothetical protein